MTFKEKLVILRKIRKITQDELASAVGVSRQAVYKWECGQSYPEVPKLLEIKFLFGISIDDLLDDSYEIALPEKKKRRRRKNEEATNEEVVVEKKEEIVVEEKKEEVKPMQDEPRVSLASLLAELEARTKGMEEKKAPAVVTEKVAPAKVEETVKVEEPVLVAAATEEAPVVIEEPKVEKTVEEAVEATAEEEAPEKKKGFFGRLFGKK